MRDVGFVDAEMLALLSKKAVAGELTVDLGELSVDWVGRPVDGQLEYCINFCRDLVPTLNESA